MQWITNASPRLKARAAGFFWLLTIVGGSLALFLGGGLGFAANRMATVSYVLAAVLVYYLLKPVNKPFSLVAAACGVIGCAIGVAQGYVEMNGQVNFVFFGLHVFLVGYLILRSTFLPRSVGGLMVFGGLSWLTMGLSSLLSPSSAASLDPYIMFPGILAETALTVWLLVKGVHVARWEEQAAVRRA